MSAISDLRSRVGSLVQACDALGLSREGAALALSPGARWDRYDAIRRQLLSLRDVAAGIAAATYHAGHVDLAELADALHGDTVSALGVCDRCIEERHAENARPVRVLPGGLRAPVGRGEEG